MDRSGIEDRHPVVPRLGQDDRQLRAGKSTAAWMAARIGSRSPATIGPMSGPPSMLSMRIGG
jgi:hypothetical protein